MRRFLMVIIPLVISVNVYAQAGAVTFYAYGSGDQSATGKSAFGHVFVSVSGYDGYENTVGFYGNDSGLTPFGTGRIRSDRDNIDFARTSYVTVVNSSQLNRVKMVIADWTRNPRTYGWKDCVGFAQDIAEACGLRHKSWQTQLPMTFIEDLYELN
jgi:hypothetical protein